MTLPSLFELFQDAARRNPGKVAIRCQGVAWTYGQLRCRAIGWSSLLHGLGVRRGDAIGVILPNRVEFVELLLAAADLGAALVPASPSTPGDALVRSFEASGVRHLVGTSVLLEGLPSFCREEGCVRVSLDGAGPGDVDLEAALAEQNSPSSQGTGRPDDPLILTTTSGSTGDPKPIVLTQETKILRARAAAELYRVTEDDVVLAATPLHHSLAERLVILPLILGSTSELMERFSPRDWVDTVRERGVTFTIAVSSQLAQIALLSEQEVGSMGSLRCVVSSSALLRDDTKRRLLGLLRCDLHECYGASEIAIATDLDLVEAKTRIATVGKPAPGVDVRILGEDGCFAPPGTKGEILCRTPMAFSGYHRRPDLTRDAMLDGFFRTGDLGVLDPDGFLTFLGRRKDLIITGGINVYPGDVEAAVATLPFVRECAAFPLPDERLGEVVALAVACPEAEWNPRAVRVRCARHLADHQQPHHLFRVDDLPRNAMGKVVKMRLAELFGPATEVPPVQES